MRFYQKFIITIMIISVIIAGYVVVKYYVTKDSQSDCFSMYLVEGVNTYNATQMHINDLKLENIPLITERNIEAYIWNEHRIDLIMNDSLFKSLEEKVFWRVPMNGKPFVIVCNGKRLYVGTFWTALSSLNAPNCPYIMSDNKESKSLYIKNYDEKKNLRNNKVLKNALKEAGKLKL